jgi:hypothetical protein
MRKLAVSRRLIRTTDGHQLLPPFPYRLNRSRKLDGKHGHYDGRPITQATRVCPARVLKSAA